MRIQSLLLTLFVAFFLTLLIIVITGAITWNMFNGQLVEDYLNLYWDDWWVPSIWGWCSIGIMLASLFTALFLSDLYPILKAYFLDYLLMGLAGVFLALFMFGGVIWTLV